MSCTCSVQLTCQHDVHRYAPKHRASYPQQCLRVSNTQSRMRLPNWTLTVWAHSAVAKCRYQLDWAGPQFGAFTPKQHIDYANTTQVQRMAGYLKKGGLPPIVGEWALAGPQRSPLRCGGNPLSVAALRINLSVCLCHGMHHGRACSLEQEPPHLASLQCYSLQTQCERCSCIRALCRS